MNSIIYSQKFKRDYKRLKKKHFNIKKLQEVVHLLMMNETLPLKYHDHALSGDLQGMRELHIEKDWLLIYQINDDELTLLLLRTGSHDQLFK